MTRPDAGPSRTSDGPRRAHKSSDRLHRLGAGSSTSHLAGKRSKSQTQLASAGPSTSGKQTSSKSSKKNKDDNDDDSADEEGWTSASAANTPDQSLQPSDEEEEDDDDDGGLVMGSKAKGKTQVKQHQVDQPQPLPPDSSIQQSSLGAAEPSSSSSQPPPPPHLSESNRTSSQNTIGSTENQQSSKEQCSSPTSLGPSAPSTAPISSHRVASEGTASTRQHQRTSSSASVRTLTGGYVLPSSGSVSSRMSTRSRTSLLLPKDNHTAAPPMLSTHNALAGHLGSLQEAHNNEMMYSPKNLSRQGSRQNLQQLPPSASMPVGLGDLDLQLAGRGRRDSTASQSSNLTLPAMPGASGSRSKNNGGGTYNSLTAADASKLAAKLRQARDAMDAERRMEREQHLEGRSSTTRGGMIKVQVDSRHFKPLVSNFAKDAERRTKPMAVTITPNSVFWPDWLSMGKAEQARRSKEVQSSSSRRYIRYVGRYGLSGAPIEETPLNEALLAPSFDGDEFESSWAPALANAAGLGPRGSIRSRHHQANMMTASQFIEDGIPLHDPMTFTGSAAVNGPNATPVHLMHGLTTISPDDFPLDPADAPTLIKNGKNNARRNRTHLHDDDDEEEDDDEDPNGDEGFTASPATLRAIALTSQMLSTHRSHTMTRRYYDPLREGLDRVVTQLQKNNPSAYQQGVGGGGGSGNVTPSAGGVYPSSPLAREVSNSGSAIQLLRGSSHSGQYHGGSNSRSASGQSFGAAGNSVQGLQRVWSSRGNLTAEREGGRR